MTVAIPTRQSPSDEALRTLAESVGHALAQSYVAFVRKHDGARPEENSFITPNNEVGVQRFIPVGEAATLVRKVDKSPAKVIVFAEDDSGNYFYVRPQTGTVYFGDHEIEGDDEQVATSAQAFADQLIPFDPAQVQLPPGEPGRVGVRPGFKPEF